MGNNLFMEIDNYEVYLSQVSSIAEKETFTIAVKELVQAINTYTKENAKNRYQRINQCRYIICYCK